jgi:hypothetical protein
MYFRPWRDHAKALEDRLDATRQHISDGFLTFFDRDVSLM